MRAGESVRTEYVIEFLTNGGMWASWSSALDTTEDAAMNELRRQQAGANPGHRDRFRLVRREIRTVVVAGEGA